MKYVRKRILQYADRYKRIRVLHSFMHDQTSGLPLAGIGSGEASPQTDTVTLLISAGTLFLSPLGTAQFQGRADVPIFSGGTNRPQS